MLVAKITFLNTASLQSESEIAAWMGLFNWKAMLLAAVLLIATRGIKPLKKLHPVVFILASALIGILFSF